MRVNMRWRVYVVGVKKVYITLHWLWWDLKLYTKLIDRKWKWPNCKSHRFVGSIETWLYVFWILFGVHTMLCPLCLFVFTHAHPKEKRTAYFRNLHKKKFDMIFVAFLCWFFWVFFFVQFVSDIIFCFFMLFHGST